MDKTELYRVLDIENADEFKYYENVASLLEEDQMIEQNLLDNLLSEIDLDQFKELMVSYFDEFLSKIPDDEPDLYVMTETLLRALNGKEDAHGLADWIYHFRKWYVIDTSVTDRETGRELNVRDARYNLSAAKFTGEHPDYDFSRIYMTDMDGYDMLVSDMIDTDPGAGAADTADTEDYE